MRARFRVDSRVRAVKGPGSSMDAEPYNIGKTGTVIRVEQARGAAEPHYVVGFPHNVFDTIDESSLERA